MSPSPSDYLVRSRVGPAVKVERVSTPKPESSRPPLRALAMVLIALAILFAGLGAASLTKSDTESAPVAATTPSVAASPTRPPAATPTAVAAPTGSAVATTSANSTTAEATIRSVPVRVLNNSTVAGLAAKTAGILEAQGWTVSETGNYSAGRIPATTVYFGTSDSEKQAALEIASELGATAQPRFAGLDTSSPGVIVIVTAP